MISLRTKALIFTLTHCLPLLQSDGSTSSRCQRFANVNALFALCRDFPLLTPVRWFIPPPRSLSPKESRLPQPFHFALRISGRTGNPIDLQPRDIWRRCAEYTPARPTSPHRNALSTRASPTRTRPLSPCFAIYLSSHQSLHLHTVSLSTNASKRWTHYLLMPKNEKVR